VPEFFFRIPAAHRSCARLGFAESCGPRLSECFSAAFGRIPNVGAYFSPGLRGEQHAERRAESRPYDESHHKTDTAAAAMPARVIPIRHRIAPPQAC
jgi:hypothetical protein